MGALKVLIAGMSQSGGGGSGGGIGGTTGTTDNAITRADGTGGSTLQGSTVTISDAGQVNGTSATMTGAVGSGVPDANIFNSTAAFLGGGVYLTDAVHFGRGGSISATDTVLLSDAANTLAQRNGTNGQTWIVSRTFTDASNKSEATLVCTGTVAAFTITEAGTGIGTLTKWTFNKNVSLPTLNISAIPTSSSGLSSGDVWSNLGILTIVS